MIGSCLSAVGMLRETVGGENNESDGEKCVSTKSS